MTLAQAKVVDWLGLEKGTGDVLLTLVDDLDWSDEQGHLAMLQEKLNTYLAFIESGEVYDQVEEVVGRNVPPDVPIKVIILAKHPQPEQGRAFLGYAQSAFASAGFSLSFKVLAAGT